MAKKLMKGNEAMAEAAIQAGCRYFFGYPITPQNQIPEYLSRRMPEVGGVFLQAESEVSASNMVYGAAGAGARVMTSSSSPGISLKQEAISYMACAELPCVIVNMVRSGPGLGGIQPSQGDYFQATRGGGHGDYRLVVLAPASLQEGVELMQEAFDIADTYRIPTMVIGDGMLGQMMEPVEFGTYTPRKVPEKTWASDGNSAKRGYRNIINSLYIEPADLEEVNKRLQARYAEITAKEVKYEKFQCDDAEVVLVAYGTTARVAKSAIRILREQHGIKAGLMRPITLWPFPEQVLRTLAEEEHVKHFLAVEMSAGQMVEDVRLAVENRKPVHFYGRTGGYVPTQKEIVNEVIRIAGGEQ